MKIYVDLLFLNLMLNIFKCILLFSLFLFTNFKIKGLANDVINRT